MATTKDRYQYTLVINSDEPIWLCESEEPIYQVNDFIEFLKSNFDRANYIFKVLPISDDPEVGFDSIIDRNHFWNYAEKLLMANNIVCKDTIADVNFELY